MKIFIKKAAIFFLIFLFLNGILAGLLVVPRHFLDRAGGRMPGEWWDDFYAQKNDSIDIIFLGSSHAYSGFDPRVINEKIGLNAFVMSSGSQNPLGSYFVLREALKTQHPKLVVLETFWQTTYTDGDRAGSFFRIYPYMKFGENKISFFRASPFNKFIYLVYPSLQFKESILALPRLISGKFKRNITYHGYVAAGGLPPAPLREVAATTPFDVAAIDQKNIEYLHKIVALCRENNIPLVFVTAPVRQDMVDALGNYDQVHAVTAELAEKMQVPYIDYVMSNRTTHLFSSTDFIDSGHLNQAGAAKLSDDFSRRSKDFFTSTPSVLNAHN